MPVTPRSRRLRRRGRIRFLLTALAVVVVAAGLGLLLRTDLEIDRGAQSYYTNDETSGAVVIAGVSRGGRGALSWPGWGFDAAHHRRNPEAQQRPPFRTRWTSGFDSLIEFPPVVDEGGMFVQTAKGRIFSISLKNGKQLWNRHVTPPLASSPTVDAHRVYTVSLGGESVTAFRRSDGRRVWRYAIGARSESSPVLVDGVLYFGAEDGTLTALTAATGKREWRRDVGGAIKGSPAYSGGLLVVGSYDGHVSAWTAATGKRRWRTAGLGYLLSGGQFYSTPTIAYGRVYIGSTDHRVYSIVASTGRIAWTQGTGDWVYAGPAAVHGIILLGSYDGYFYAFDARTGRRRWRFNAHARISGSATVVADVVYFSTFGNGTFGLDVKTGRQRWRRHQGRYSPVVATRDDFFFVGYNTITSLRPRTR